MFWKASFNWDLRSLSIGLHTGTIIISIDVKWHARCTVVGPTVDLSAQRWHTTQIIPVTCGSVGQASKARIPVYSNYCRDLLRQIILNSKRASSMHRASITLCSNYRLKTVIGMNVRTALRWLVIESRPVHQPGPSAHKLAPRPVHRTAPMA